MSKKPRKRTRKPSPTPPRAVKAWACETNLRYMDPYGNKSGPRGPFKVPVYIIPAAAVDAVRAKYINQPRFSPGYTGLAREILADLGLGATP